MRTASVIKRVMVGLGSVLLVFSAILVERDGLEALPPAASKP